MKFSNINGKKTSWVLLLMVAIGTGISSCKKYLDIVPDNVATLENVFKLRNEAEKFLFTCYSYMPRNGDGWFNAGLTSADEIWYPQSTQTHWHPAFRIALGQQNASEPLFDEWAGARKGGDGRKNYLRIWSGIRNCNILLENLADDSKVPDLSGTERSRWIGEGLFLKAYYHYYMFRMYGPIPIMDKSANIDEIETGQIKRRSVEDCANYISGLLDSAAKKLPSKISDENNELGRATAPIALALKAKLWAMAASPLFNGNADMASLHNPDGEALFNTAPDPERWVKARDAAKAAIEAAEALGFRLYMYTNDVYGLNDKTKTQLNIRNAITQRWNPEIVWANTQPDGGYFVNQSLCMPPVQRNSNVDHFTFQGVWAPTMKMAKLFYTKNGVPMDEDKTLDFTNYEQLRTSTGDEKYDIEPGFVTARLNFDREPRYYADLGFDGSTWYMKDGNTAGSDLNTYYVKAKNTEAAGFGHVANWSETGYFLKKLVNWESTTNGSAVNFKAYPWPEVRLADLYLLYAEALNETAPGSELAISYLDKVRARAGLQGVKESWSNYSSNPTKFSTQSGLRQIIHRERTIELMFEGQRFWDLRRWKEASDELNKTITGWNILGKTSDTYYKERAVFSQRFIAPRDYFWPIGNYDTRRNPNLVENLGW